MIYYTADLHLGHENIINMCSRPFSSIDEMNAGLIDNWNSVVSDEDTVYILGDLIFRSSISGKPYLRKMKGKKHLILGNHDHKWIKNITLDEYFESVNYYLEIKDDDNRISLCHYPMLSWGGASKGSYLVFGHIHNSKDGLAFETLMKMDHALNAGVEVNCYKPVTLSELIINNREFYNNGL